MLRNAALAFFPIEFSCMLWEINQCVASCSLMLVTCMVFPSHERHTKIDFLGGEA